jgi:hypothetical protein
VETCRSLQSQNAADLLGDGGARTATLRLAAPFLGIYSKTVCQK